MRSRYAVAAVVVCLTIATPITTVMVHAGGAVTRSVSQLTPEQLCARVRAFVARFGINAAIKVAKARGLSEDQIKAGAACL